MWRCGTLTLFSYFSWFSIIQFTTVSVGCCFSIFLGVAIRQCLMPPELGESIAVWAALLQGNQSSIWALNQARSYDSRNVVKPMLYQHHSSIWAFGHLFLLEFYACWFRNGSRLGMLCDDYCAYQPIEDLLLGRHRSEPAWKTEASRWPVTIIELPHWLIWWSKCVKMDGSFFNGFWLQRMIWGDPHFRKPPTIMTHPITTGWSTVPERWGHSRNGSRLRKLRIGNDSPGTCNSLQIN